MSILKLNSGIKPFPASINRHDFGWYLSGLIDGEGHFCLIMGNSVWNNGTPRRRMHARFSMGMRADDYPILSLMQSYFGCGHIRGKKQYSEKHNPQYHYTVDNSVELLDAFIPHFDKHPLFAKKKNDYKVWREGVLLLAAIQTRSQSKRGRKHTAEEQARFEQLVIDIKKAREFNPSPLPSAK